MAGEDVTAAGSRRARRGAGVSELLPLSALDRPAEPRVSAARPGPQRLRKSEIRRRVDWAAELSSYHALPGPRRLAPVGRGDAARGDRPRHRAPTPAVPDGRAADQPGREACVRPCAWSWWSCGASWGRRWSSSPTTRPRRCRWPIASSFCPEGRILADRHAAGNLRAAGLASGGAAARPAGDQPDARASRRWRIVVARADGTALMRAEAAGPGGARCWAFAPRHVMQAPGGREGRGVRSRGRVVEYIGPTTTLLLRVAGPASARRDSAPRATLRPGRSGASPHQRCPAPCSSTSILFRPNSRAQGEPHDRRVRSNRSS